MKSTTVSYFSRDKYSQKSLENLDKNTNSDLYSFRDIERTPIENQEK